MSLGVYSETGTLRQVIVHRLGLELARLTPQNIGGLLFDTVIVLDLRRRVLQPDGRARTAAGTIHIRAVYHCHPMFAGAGFVTYLGGDDAGHLQAIGRDPA